MKHPDTCKDAQENIKLLFWLKFHFFCFFAQLRRLEVNFDNSWQVATQWNEEFDFNSGIINDSSSCEHISCHGRPKRRYKNSKKGKKSQKSRISQKFILQFSEASLHVPWCFILQTKSPTYVIKWLEGYSEILTYVREISNQSWDTNRETPGRIGWSKATRRTEGRKGAPSFLPLPVNLSLSLRCPSVMPGRQTHSLRRPCMQRLTESLKPKLELD